MRKGHKRLNCSKNDAPAKSRGIWLNIFYKLKNLDKATFLISCWSKGSAGTHFTNCQRSESSWLIRELQCTRWVKRIWHYKKGPDTNSGYDSQWWREIIRGGTKICSRSWFIRDCAITRWNGNRPTALKTLRRPRTFLCVGQRPKFTIDKWGEDNYLQNWHVPLVVPGFRKQFIV